MQTAATTAGYAGRVWDNLYRSLAILTFNLFGQDFFISRQRIRADQSAASTYNALLVLENTLGTRKKNVNSNYTSKAEIII